MLCPPSQDFQLKNAFAIVALSAMLSACSTLIPVPQQPAAPATSSTEADESASDSREEAEAKVAAKKLEDSLPKLELGKELMLKLMGAELAYQRGAWQTAYVTMLGAAQQTRDPRIARRAMEIAIDAKQPGEALAAIRLWRELAPQSEEAIQYYLGFVALSDNPSESKPIFEARLKEAGPERRAAVIFQTQQFLNRAKNKTVAFDLLDQILEPYQSMVEAHLVLAQSAFNKGDGKRALEEAQTAMALKPDSELAALTLAQVSPDPKTGSKLLTDFLAKHPKSREIRVAYARMLVEQKKYDLARGEFEMLLKAQPNDLATLYALGVVSMQMNDNASAENHFKKYLAVMEAQEEEGRDPTQVLTILSQLAEDRGDLDTALTWLSKIEPNENNATAVFDGQIRRAQIVGKRGDVTSARKMLAAIPAVDPREQVKLLLAESQILREANQMQQAFDLLKAGSKRFPGNADVLYDYAMAAEKLNLVAVMETALREVIALAPKNHHAYNALGYSLADRNIRLQEAYVLIEKALSMAPDDPFIMDSMAWVQFRLGKFEKAEELLRQAYALRPDAEIAVHLGEVLWSKGQKDAAQKLWREAKSKDPKSDILKSTLARFNVRL